MNNEWEGSENDEQLGKVKINEKIKKKLNKGGNNNKKEAKKMQT